MGLITPENENYFKPASIIYSKIKRDFSSYDTVNMIDEGEFPEYIKHVLKLIGIGVYKESDAVMSVKNYKAKLPKDFSQLYAAYKCTPFVEANDVAHLQGQPISVYNDVTWELLQGGDNCDIECLNNTNHIIEKITVRQYVKETPIIVNFKNPILLSLSPNVHSNKCAEDCQNLLSSSMHEITLSDGFMYTNFLHDAVYMKYYAFPYDKDGVPMIPDIEKVERAIEWCIKYNLLQNWWFNGSVPDIQNKMQYAQQQYDFWLAEARKERKMPYFTQMINNIRNSRAINKLVVFSQ